MVFSWKMVLDGAKVAKKYAVKYAPQILTGVGIGLMAGATVHAIATAPKAKAALDKIEDNPDLNHKQYILKKTRTLAAFYWPELLMTFGGAGLIIGGQHISLKRLGMATAIIGSQREEIKDLKDKVAEKFGDKKLTEIEDEITKDKVKKELESGKGYDLSGYYNTGHGNQRFYDPIGKRFFLSDMEYIRRTAEDFNEDRVKRAFDHEQCMKSLNSWYEAIGLPPLNGHSDYKHDVYCPDIGKDWGWKNRALKVRFTHMDIDEDVSVHVMGYAEDGGPRWFQNIGDYDMDPIVSDRLDDY